MVKKMKIEKKVELTKKYVRKHPEEFFGKEFSDICDWGIEGNEEENERGYNILAEVIYGFENDFFVKSVTALEKEGEFKKGDDIPYCDEEEIIANMEEPLTIK